MNENDLDFLVLDEIGTVYQCIHDGCDSDGSGITGANRYCVYHKNRLKRYGNPNIHRIARYSPEYRAIDSQGYITVHHPDTAHLPFTKYILEHRLVMEQYIGRPLLEHENVHHRNGNRADNRLSNLELWSTSQPSGQRVDEKVGWAREIIELYETFVQPNNKLKN